eukprot:scaffold61706_cov63-Phaeocystis_antarctica.AAC.2
MRSGEWCCGGQSDVDGSAAVGAPQHHSALPRPAISLRQRPKVTNRVSFYRLVTISNLPPSSALGFS